MKEWIVQEEDIGVNGEYFNYQPLIRCKDCKHHELIEDYSDDFEFCNKWKGETKEDGWCYKGARKE